MSRVTEAHLQARRKSILAAAARLFAGRGFANATMANIAEEAGLSAGAIYRYFESKSALAAACFEVGAEQLAAEWQRQFHSSADTRSVFHNIAQNSFAEISGEGADERTRLMLEGYLEAIRAGDSSVEDCRRDRNVVITALASALARLQAESDLPRDLDVRSLAGALWSFWLGARVARMLDPLADTDAQLAAIWELFQAVFSTRGAKGPETVATAATRPRRRPAGIPG
jgi:AcrR family transcriptional regulator